MRIDDIIKKKLSELEAPADAMAWGRLEASLSSATLDDIVKDKLDNYEAPFDAKAWNQLEPSIAGSSATPFFGPLVAGVAATVLLTSLFTSLPNMKPSDDINLNSEMITIDHEIPVNISNENEVLSDGHAPQEVHEITLSEGDLNTTSIKRLADHQADKIDLVGQSELEANSFDGNIEHTNNANTILAHSHRADFTAKGIQCANREIQFQAALESSASVTWIFDGIHVKEGLKTNFSFDTPGQHEARMTASFADGAEFKLVKKVMIYENPVAQFQFESDAQKECFKVPVRLSTTPVENTYKWLVDGDTVGKGAELSKSLNTGTHNVGMLAINKEGCTSYAMRAVLVESSLLIIPPLAFSPSDANGLNDVWSIVGLKSAEKFELKIFRLGSKSPIFESIDSPSWDGTISGSAERPRKGDVFEWVLIATDNCGETVQRNGSISCL
jgi:hypothetical protein